MTVPKGVDVEAATQAPDASSGTESTLAGPAISATQNTVAQVGRTSPASAELVEVTRAHYEVGAELARGGMGRILVARDRRIGRTVALKELLGTGEGITRRFEREALVTGRLQHPAIVPVYEAGRWPSGEPFYAMKLVAGKSLEKVILEKPAFDDRLALLPTVIQIAEAIAYAHGERVIHRDLKPANVLVGAFGETVVIDWGLAKDLSADEDASEVPAGPYRSNAAGGELTVMGSIMGTPVYMPPEQASGDPVDERADVYALGAILYHVLAGKAPYTGTTVDGILARVIAEPPPPIAKRAPEVPAELVTILEKAMAREPADRYPTARELAAELVRFQAGKLVSAHRYSAWALTRRFVRRHRAAFLALLALIVVGGVIAVVSVRQILGARDRATTALGRAEAERRAFLEEQGRRELYAGHTPRAAAYLAEAYASGPPSDTLRLMLAQAMRPLDALIATVDTGAPVELLVVAPDGQRFATSGEAGQIGLWTADGHAIAKLATDLRHVSTLAFSRDSTRLAVGGTGDGVTVWDARDGHRLASFPDSDGLQVLAFAVDGARVFGADTIKTRVWDVATGRVLGVAPATPANVLAITSDGTRLTAADGAMFAILDPTDLHVLAAHAASADISGPAAISADGNRLIVSAAMPPAPPTAVDPGEPDTMRLELFDPHHPDAPLATFRGASSDDVALDADGDRVLRIPEAADVELYGAGAGYSPTRVAAVSADGTRVATTDATDVIWLWDDHGDLVATLPGHRRHIVALAFSPDGTRMFSAGEEGVRVWRVPVRGVRQLGVATLADASPDGKHAIAIAEHTVVIYDVATTAVVGKLAGIEDLWSATYSPDGGRIATTTAAGHVNVWDVRSERPTTTIETIAFATQFSPDGSRLVTAGELDAILWDAATGARVLTLPGSDEIVTTARFSPDGTRIVTAARDGFARVYDARTGQRLLELGGHAEYLVNAVFDATGTHILTASGDGTAGLWNATTGARTATLGGHTTALHTAAFSRDGGRVLTIGSEGGRVWDAASGALVITLPSTDEVVDGRFLGDGSLVAIATLKGAVIWEATRGEPLLALPPAVPPRAVPSVAIGHPYMPIHDPRQRAGNLVEARDGSWVSFGHGWVFPLPREQRPVNVITALVEARSGWREHEGGLLPSGDAGVYRTDERASVATSEKVYDFSQDVITGDLDPPGAYVATEPSPADEPAGRIHRAFLARTTRSGLLGARALVDGLGDVPAVPPMSLYELAWLRSDLGDSAAAYKALQAAAANWPTPASAAIVRGELVQMSVAVGAKPDDVLAMLAASPIGKDVEPASLLAELADTYNAVGERAHQEAVLAKLVPIASPAVAMGARMLQARNAIFADHLREFADRAEDALDLFEHHPEISVKERTGVADTLQELAYMAQATYMRTMDERYARAALRVELHASRAHAFSDPKLPEYIANLRDGIAHGPWTAGDFDKAILRRAFQRHLTQIERCYKRVLTREPTIAGQISLQLFISNGAVTKVVPTPARGTTGLAAVADCVADEVQRIVLPRPAYAPHLVVTFPVTFKVSS